MPTTQATTSRATPAPPVRRAASRQVQAPDGRDAVHGGAAVTGGHERFPTALTATPLRLAELLRQQPLFEVLPAELISLLADRAQLRHFAKESCVVEQGTRDAMLHVLLRGRAHAERAGDNGRLVLLDVLGPGDRIGERPLIDGQPHAATVRCVAASDVLVLRHADVQHCLRHSPSFSGAWMVELVRQMRAVNRRIQSMALSGVRERVLWQLWEWAEHNRHGEPVVSSRVSRSELARMIGASREMVCRVLRTLHAGGVLELRRDRSIVLLLDPPAAGPAPAQVDSSAALKT